jgi:hypothetical protein
MPSQQEQAIQERAYAIWEEEDRPDGKALDHWLRAEAENTATRMTNSIDTDLEEFLSALEPLIRDISHLTWENAPPPMFEIVCCAAICRQFEAIQASKDMTRRDTGHFGVLFLRAACEELIWIRYLNSIDPKVADIIIHCLVQKETHDLVNGQEQFSGRNSLIKGGFSPKFLNDKKDTSKQAHTLLKSIGVKLKWPTSPLPTVAFLARRTGSTKLYNYLYHASSRFVHFSTVELLRRGWGKPGELNLGSSHYSGMWTKFALFWGCDLLRFTLAEVLEATHSREFKALQEIDIDIVVGALRKVQRALSACT